MLKKSISVLLSLVMILSIFTVIPISAAAEEAEPTTVIDLPAEEDQAEDTFREISVSDIEGSSDDSGHDIVPVAEDDPYKCGDNASYAFTESTGELRISGTGSIYGYSDASKTPWNSIRSRITSVVIEDGITAVGKNAFAQFVSLTKVEIPASVTSVGVYAFRGCSSLTEVRLPDSVEAIGSYAFAECSNLSQINIPLSWNDVPSSNYNDNASYEGYIFKDCAKLTKITVPEGVDYLPAYAFNGCNKIKEAELPESLAGIKNDTFRACSSLESITIPDGITAVSTSVFQDCGSLKTIGLPSGLKNIGLYAFRGCVSLTEVTLPDSVESIGSYAFAECSNLSQINIPLSWNDVPSSRYNDNASYEGYIFKDCAKLTKITVPEGVAYLPAYAFNGCNKIKEAELPESLAGIKNDTFRACGSLESITIPDGITAVGASAFQDCGSLKTIGLPSGLKNIGLYAFRSCVSLTEVTLPDSVESIGSYAFAECSNLTQINIPLSWNDVPSSNYNDNASYEGYIFKDCAKLTKITVPEGVAYLPAYAFNGCNKIKEAELPESLEGVKNDTFRACGSLESITIPDGITAVGASAFQDCGSLKTIGLPSGLKNIGLYAFRSCASLTEVTLPDSVESIGSYAFAECSNLSQINIPLSWNDVPSSRYNDNASYEGYVFKDCTKLTKITIPEGFTQIPAFGFNGCNKIKEVILPESLTAIGNYAFNTCENMTAVTIRKNVISIGDSAFSRCKALSAVTLPAELKKIGSYAFNECVSFTAVTVPAKVTTVGIYVYSGCSELKKVTIRGKIQILPERMFNNCLKLEEVSIPTSVSEIQEYAFSGCVCLRSATLPAGLKTIGNFAFLNCASLHDIIIPDLVSNIGGNVFKNCAALKKAVFYTENAKIGSDVFSGCHPELTVYCNMDSAVATYMRNQGINCDDLFSSFKGKVTVAADDGFNGYKVKLIKENGSAVSRTIKDGSAIFSGADPSSEYSAVLMNKNDRIIDSAERVVFGEDDLAVLAFDSSSMLQYSIEVVDENGTVVDDYTVAWYIGGSKSAESTGRTVKDLKEGDSLRCTVKLSDALIREYEPPEDVQEVVSSADKILRVSLERAKTFPVTVTVADPDGMPLDGASVNLIQSISASQNSSLSAFTDSHGKASFALREFGTSVAVSADGYLTEEWRGVPDRDNSEIRVTLKPNDGVFFIPRYYFAELEESAGDNAYSQDTDHLQFELYNQTKKKAIEEFYVENGCITVPYTALDREDEIRITVRDDTGFYSETTSEVKYTDGTNSFAVLLTENGFIDLQCDSQNAKDMALLFDAGGSYVTTITFSGSAVSGHLPKGKYTAVLMGYDPILYCVDSYQAFTAYPLIENTDYIVKEASVIPGTVTKLKASVPKQNEELGLYLDAEATYVQVNPYDVVENRYATVTVSYSIKENCRDRIKPNRLIIRVADGMKTYPAITVDGVEVTGYLYDENSFEIPIENSSGSVDVVTRIEGWNEQYLVTAELVCSDNGTQIVQPVGTGFCVFKNRFFVSQYTANGHLAVSGTTSPDASVSIFVDGERYAEVTASQMGAFYANVYVDPNASSRYHSISFEVRKNDYFYKTQEYYTEYNENAVTVDSIYMSPNGHKKTVKLYSADGNYSRSYNYVPGKFYSLTFTVDFIGNCDILRDVVLITGTKSGDEIRIPLTRVGDTNSYSCVYSYKHSELPCQLGVSYQMDFDTTTTYDEPEIDYAGLASQMEDAANEYNQALAKYQEWLKTAPPEKAARATALVNDFKAEISRAAFPYEVTEEAGGNKSFCDRSTGEKVSIREWADPSATAEKLKAEGYTAIPSASGKETQFMRQNGTVITQADLTSKKFVEISFDINTSAPVGSDLAPVGGIFGDVYNFGRDVSNWFNNINNGVRQMCDVIVRDAKALNNLSIAEDFGALSNVAKSVGKVAGTINVATNAIDTIAKGIRTAQYRMRANGFRRELSNLRAYMSSRKCYTDFSYADSIENSLDHLDELIILEALAAACKGSLTVVGALSMVTPVGPFAAIAISAGSIVMNAAIEGAGIEKSAESLISEIDSQFDEAVEYLNSHKCSEDDEDYQRQPDGGGPSTQTTTSGIADPSGYVCEAVSGNRIEGVTTTLYYSPNEDGSDAQFWNAEDYDQMNPLITDSMGKYEWYVPDGFWQVKYEKDDYETCYSDWLPVPPPQFDVNVAMISTLAPEVESCAVYPDSAIIMFSQYMNINTVNTANVTLRLGENILSGTITPLNKEAAFGIPDVYYASKFVYQFDDRINIGDKVTLKVSAVRNYADSYFDAPYSNVFTVEDKIVSVMTHESVTVVYGAPETVQLRVLTENGFAAVKKVRIATENSSIFEISDSVVTTDQIGMAQISVTALYPGTGKINFTVEGTNVTAAVTVNCVLESQAKQLEMVSASVPSGSTVAQNTVITLSHPNPDAKIYYTLDLSCPCQVNNPARILYTGPITISEDTNLMVYAVLDGYEDSKTTLYTYSVKSKKLLGDVDGDGFVTIIDATMIQRHLAGLSTFAYDEEAADSDEDGEISIIDATFIQRWLAGLSSNENIGMPVRS